MDLIIGRFLPPLNSSKTVGSVRRRDDKSRGKVRKVGGGGRGGVGRADSSAGGRAPMHPTNLLWTTSGRGPESCAASAVGRAETYGQVPGGRARTDCLGLPAASLRFPASSFKRK